jgi:hypothetical protein
MTRRMCRYLLGPLALVPLAACSITADSRASRPRPPVVLGDGLRFVDRDYLHRYVCAEGQPVTCACQSRLSRECLCECSGRDLLPLGLGR